MKILVTGASGFMGSAFIRHALLRPTNDDIAVRAFYGSSHERCLKCLEPVLHLRGKSRLQFCSGDLRSNVFGLCENIDVVFHFAARTFVDHSILSPSLFVDTNVVGTLNLLEDANRFRVKRFIQVSTDEVYGEIMEGAHPENAPIDPHNPYAASKAAADALVLGYGASFGMHVTITRTENNYGPYQTPQKLIPKFVHFALSGKKLPVYGDGRHSRQWLWVDDHAEALLVLLRAEYESGQVFHIGANQEIQNLELARLILQLLERSEENIELVSDSNIRPSHDRRYALSCEKIHKFGWNHTVSLEEGVERAVNWYKCNPSWFF